MSRTIAARGHRPRVAIVLPPRSNSPAAAQQALDSLLRAQRVPALAAAVIEPGRIR